MFFRLCNNFTNSRFDSDSENTDFRACHIAMSSEIVIGVTPFCIYKIKNCKGIVK